MYFTRLVEASRLKDHQVCLECYHPSEKLSTPSLFCDYLGMDGLTEAGDDANLGELNNLYARFLPYLGDEDHRPRSRRQFGTPFPKAFEPITELPSHEVFLESGELFSQLCTVTNLVKVGPRHGLFSSIANVTDSVIRVWRDWLHREAAKAAVGQQQSISAADDPSILWTDSLKTVGLKFRVVKDESVPAPILFGQDEEPSVSYKLEYEGMLVNVIDLVMRPCLHDHRIAY